MTPNHRRQYESWMGHSLQYYKPRVTLHSLINRLFAKPQKAIAAGVVPVERELFSDVSFYQGDINWLIMRTKARKVIIRAGQNLWVDIRFVTNYLRAKQTGFLRGVYWFYDGRASPGAQAALLVSFIQGDPPEFGIWIDWERNYGGAHEGLRNVVAMMQEVERLLPGVEVGMYTGFYFFVENSNRILHASQYAYLATKKLWLAFYAALADVRIPSLWPHMTYWQKGTPSVGKEWGVETIEIDMNEDMDGDPLPPPIPPPIEEPMTQYRFTVLTNERTSTNATITTNLTGRVYAVGDVVNVVEVVLVGGNQWFKLDNGRFAAYIYNGATRAVLVDMPDPDPVPVPGLPVINVDVVVSGEGYVTQKLIVELRPK